MSTCLFLLMALFFFSSRRRHTRWPRDWSSDVCSSDLVGFAGIGWIGKNRLNAIRKADIIELVAEIGRASCREREWSAEGDEPLKKNMASERASEHIYLLTDDNGFQETTFT